MPELFGGIIGGQVGGGAGGPKSITGPGVTTNPGALTQHGNWLVNLQGSAASTIEMVPTAGLATAPSILFPLGTTPTKQGVIRSSEKLLMVARIGLTVTTGGTLTLISRNTKANLRGAQAVTITSVHSHVGLTANGNIILTSVLGTTIFPSAGVFSLTITKPSGKTEILVTAPSCKLALHGTGGITFQGTLVNTAATSAGQALVATGTGAAHWATVSATHVTMGGDVTGNSTNATVAKIRGRTVTAGAPSAFEVYAWTNPTTKWVATHPLGLLVAGTNITITTTAGKAKITASGATRVTMGGTVTGTSTNARVVGIRGHAVKTVSPNTGQALVWKAATSQYVPAPVHFPSDYIYQLSTV